MSAFTSYEELKVRLDRAPDATQRQLHFAATLKESAGASTDRFFVVGGSAIEIYTVGEYTSGDIDVVSDRNERLREVLKSWNFRGQGRIWANEELGLVVDLVRYPYTGDFDKTTVMSTPYGPVRLAAIEDLLVKRLASAKHWSVRGDFDHALLLGAAYEDRMDWDYVERFSREREVSDYLAALRRAIDSRRASQPSGA